MDFFALLGIIRTAQLDEETLKQAYAQHSLRLHPDQGGEDQQAAQLNLAYETLKNVASRLKHLLHLEAPEAEQQWRSVPMSEGMMQLFNSVGDLVQKSKLLLDQQSQANSRLSRALLTPKFLALRDEVEVCSERLVAAKQHLLRQLAVVDEMRDLGDPEVWSAMHLLRTQWAYIERWHTQTQELWLQLDPSQGLIG